MINRDAFNRTIERKWAAYLGIDPETVGQAGTRLVAAPRFAGTGKVDVFHLPSLTVVRVDPAWEEALREVVKEEGGERPLSLADLNLMIDGAWLEAEETTLIFHLYPADLRPAPPADPYRVRRLNENDAEAMAALLADAPEDEAAEADIGVDHDVAFGCFRDGMLAAGASGFRLAGFMDVGVLTHPDFRRQGLGKTAVASLCQWEIAQDELLLYRCRAGNEGSRRLGESLGFRLHFRQESAHLKE